MKLVITASTFSEIIKGHQEFADILKSGSNRGLEIFAPVQIQQDLDGMRSFLARNFFIFRDVYDFVLKKYLPLVKLLNPQQDNKILIKAGNVASQPSDVPYIAIALSINADGIWEEKKDFFVRGVPFRQYTLTDLTKLPRETVHILEITEQEVIAEPISRDFKGPVTPGFNLQYVKALLSETFPIIQLGEKMGEKTGETISEMLPDISSVTGITEYSLLRVVEQEEFAVITLIKVQKNLFPLKNYEEIIIEWDGELQDWADVGLEKWDLNTKKEIYVYWGLQPEFLSEDLYDTKVQNAMQQEDNLPISEDRDPAENMVLTSNTLSKALNSRQLAEKEYRASWKSLEEFNEMTGIPVTKDSFREYKRVWKINNILINFTSFYNKLEDQEWNKRWKKRMKDRGIY